MKLGFAVGLLVTAGWLPRALVHAAVEVDPTARRFVRQALPHRRHHVAV